MAIYTKKEFAEKCGFTTKILAVHILRGKLTVNNNMIDDSDLQNSFFLKKYSGVIRTPKEVSLEVEAEPKTEKTKEAQPENQRFNLETEKKSLDIEKITEEIKLLKVKTSKASGEVIPTEVVRMVFAQHFKSLTAAFQNAADNLLMDIQKMKNLSREEVAHLRGQLVIVVNGAIDEGVKESKKSISNIVQEYSDKKGVGERQ